MSPPSPALDSGARPSPGIRFQHDVLRNAVDAMRLPGRIGGPMRDQLLGMAYVDGELTGNDSHRFEAQSSGDQALQHEVADLKAFFDLIAWMSSAPEPRTPAKRHL